MEELDTHRMRRVGVGNQVKCKPVDIGCVVDREVVPDRKSACVAEFESGLLRVVLFGEIGLQWFRGGDAQHVLRVDGAVETGDLDLVGSRGQSLERDVFEIPDALGCFQQVALGIEQRQVEIPQFVVEFDSDPIGDGSRSESGEREPVFIGGLVDRQVVPEAVVFNDTEIVGGFRGVVRFGEVGRPTPGAVGFFGRDDRE